MDPSLVVAVGLLVGVGPAVVDPGGLNPFLPARTAATWLGLAGVVAVAGMRRPALPTWALGAGVGLVAWLGLAAVLSAAPVTSLLGTPTRLLGWVAWLGFALAAGAGAAVGARLGAVTALALIARWSAVPVLVGFVLAAAEVVGSPIVRTALSFEGRVLGLFGNPGLTAAHLVLVLPLAAACIRQDAAWRRLHTATLVTGVLTLLATQARAALVATALALAVLWGWDHVPRGRRARRRSQGAAAPQRLVVALAAVAVVAAALVVSGRWSGAGATLGGRVDTWRVAATTVADHPVVGVGPEGFAAAFVQRVDEAFVVAHSREQLTDRAHDVLLDVAAAGGVPALVLLVVLLVGVVLAVRGRVASSPVALAAALGSGAYVLQQLVLFPQPVHDLLLWFVLGTLLAPSSDDVPRGRATTRVVGSAAAIVLVAVGGLAVAADRLDAGAYRLAPAPGAEQAARAVDLHPVGDQHALVVADRAAHATAPEVLREAEAVVARAQGRSFPTGLLAVARVDLLLRLHEVTPDGDRAALGAAEAIVATLLERDGTNGEAWLKYGVVLHEQGRRDEAVEAWRRAELLLPGRAEPRRNLEAVGAA